MKEGIRLEQKWSQIQTRFLVISELIESAQSIEFTQMERLSDQLDELIMLLADLGIEARQQIRQQMKAVESDQLSDENVLWLNDLLKR